MSDEESVGSLFREEDKFDRTECDGAADGDQKEQKHHFFNSFEFEFCGYVELPLSR